MPWLVICFVTMVKTFTALFSNRLRKNKMDSMLIIIVTSLAIASIINIILTKFAVSHIVGYIITGTLVSNIFTTTINDNQISLELIGEFGIVFLMFTIGLEMSVPKLNKMRKDIFINGTLQVCLSALIIFFLSYYLFNIELISSIIVALAFSLSSTAIVLTYLKKSKDILTPYGQKSVAILVFQDLAVIPILLLIGFLSNNDLPITQVITNTIFYAILIIVFMFTIGKRLIGWLLHFSTKAKMEEIFLGSVLTIVLSSSLIAHNLGFTFSLGAFIAGMIIAETSFHMKVESDISSYKDLLLGAFFFSIGTKIDVTYFAMNFHIVLFILFLVMLIKALLIFFLIRKQSNKSDAIKSAFALCQVGEFSFAIFALASKQQLIEEPLLSILILISVSSMLITPFMVNNIYKLAALFVTEFFESDKISPIDVSNHCIVCGFDVLGRIVAKDLVELNRPFVIISDNLQHVILARKEGYQAYFGHLDKLPVQESLRVEQSDSIIITVNTINTKRLICESVLGYFSGAKLIVNINSLEEKQQLAHLPIKAFVHAQRETASLLVHQSTLLAKQKPIQSE